MTVQDDERERELVRLFNLDWDHSHQRDGVDATLTVEHAGRQRMLDVEVKSTTKDTVSTARDVGMTHIGKWRNKLFVIGFYSRDARRPELLNCLCLTPVDMAPWIDALEKKIQVDCLIADRAGARLTLDDLHAVCGAKDQYTLADARAVLKQQWNVAEYTAGADLLHEGVGAYSPQAMLNVLQLRGIYLARRGATLNNPHITKAHLSSFLATDRAVRGDWAASIRRIALDWLNREAMGSAQ